MKAHIDAIVALLAEHGLTAYYVDVPAMPVMPYILIWSSSGVGGPERAVSGRNDLADDIGVTSVASSGENVLLVRDRVRAALAAGPLFVPGRVVWLTLADSRRTDVDRDVTPPVAFGVDLFRLISTAA